LQPTGQPGEILAGMKPSAGCPAAELNRSAWEGKMVTIQPERPDDIAAVRTLNETAFGQPSEAAIVDSIRAACPDAVSLVAVDDSQVVGHIFFSPVFASGERGTKQGMGLAPMAVLPERQRQGVGSMLVQAGIEAMRERDCPFIIVLGHPEYYPRFGFVPASQHGLSCQWDGVPDEAFMVLILDEDAMAGVSGTARYRDEFDQAM
jgi:putative acetyltransferase